MNNNVLVACNILLGSGYYFNIEVAIVNFYYSLFIVYSISRTFNRLRIFINNHLLLIERKTIDKILFEYYTINLDITSKKLY